MMVFAWIRSLESQISYWAGRPHDALRYAQSGASFAANTRSSMAVWVPASEARAWAVLGNANEAVAAIQRAEAALDVLGPDELELLGGLCTFRPARQLYYAADALVWLPSEAERAEDYATRAVEAYDDRDTPEWSFGDQAGSQANLAIARALQGEQDGAAEALRPVLDLTPELRINGIVRSALRVHDALRRSPIAQSTTALQQEIEEFTRTPLPALPPTHG
jgi:tetratricopeptide (TPR) repeat protein